MKRLSPPALPSWLDRMVPFDRYMVDIGEHRIHVMEVGEGTPVVLVHGNPAWGFLYRKVAEALRGKGLRVIMPDLVGLGFSTKPRRIEDHSLDRHIGWMTRLLDALALDRAIVAVQDWGGAIGVGALAERPSLRAGLVVMNTVVGPPKKNFRPTAFHRFANLPIVSDAVFRLGGFPQNILSRVQGDPSSIQGEVSRAYRYPLRNLADRIAPLALARMVPSSASHPSIPALKRCQAYVSSFRGPSAIVWGDRDPVLGRMRSWIEKQFPDAQITRTQAGHFVQEEAPLEIASAILGVAEKL